MNKIRLLLVEDDEAFAYIIKGSLELTGDYEVFTANNGSEGYEQYKALMPDIIVSDIEMPETSGFEMVQRIRMENTSIPILFATARKEPHDLILGYKYGGNNYIRKPYLPEEINAHILALLKLTDVRKNKIEEPANEYYIGQYLFNHILHYLQLNDLKINLSARESDILKMLYAHKNKIVKRDDILVAFWGNNDFFTSRSLDVFISKLRKHLEKDPTVQITTIRSEGFRLVC